MSLITEYLSCFLLLLHLVLVDYLSYLQLILVSCHHAINNRQLLILHHILLQPIESPPQFTTQKRPAGIIPTGLILVYSFFNYWSLWSNYLNASTHAIYSFTLYFKYLWKNSMCLEIKITGISTIRVPIASTYNMHCMNLYMYQPL